MRGGRHARSWAAPGRSSQRPPCGLPARCAACVGGLRSASPPRNGPPPVDGALRALNPARCAAIQKAGAYGNGSCSSLGRPVHTRRPLRGRTAYPARASLPLAGCRFRRPRPHGSADGTARVATLVPPWPHLLLLLLAGRALTERPGLGRSRNSTKANDPASSCIVSGTTPQLHCK